MISDTCEICGGIGCRTYPLMLERFAAGRDRAHWRRVHDRLNSPETDPSPEDLALRAYVSRRPCCG